MASFVTEDKKGQSEPGGRQCSSRSLIEINTPALEHLDLTHMQEIRSESSLAHCPFHHEDATVVREVPSRASGSRHVADLKEKDVRFSHRAISQTAIRPLPKTLCTQR